MFHGVLNYADGDNHVDRELSGASVQEIMDDIRRELPDAELLDEQESKSRFLDGRSQFFWGDKPDDNLVGLVAWTDSTGNDQIVATIFSPGYRK